MKRNVLFTVGLMGGLMVASIQCAFGIILQTHSGNTNPTTEGLTHQAGLGVFSEGPVNDGGTNAWNITTDAGAYDEYDRNLTVAEQALLSGTGDSLTVRLRIVSDQVAGTDENIAADMIFGGSRYSMRFGIDGSGNFVVNPGGWFTYTVPGGTSYHTVVMDDRGNTGSYRFYIDGELQANPGYTGQANGSTRIAFGDFTQTGSSAENVNWEFVQLEVFVPEPSTALLLLCGSLVIYRRRRA